MLKKSVLKKLYDKKKRIEKIGGIFRTGINNKYVFVLLIINI